MNVSRFNYVLTLQSASRSQNAVAGVDSQGVREGRAAVAATAAIVRRTTRIVGGRNFNCRSRRDCGNREAVCAFPNPECRHRDWWQS